MEKIVELMEIVKNLQVTLPELIVAIEVALVSLLAVALIIPGDQPDKALQAAINFIKKLSIKKK